MEEFKKLHKDVTNWADSTFGRDRRAIPALHHMKKEITEAIGHLEKFEAGDLKELDNINFEYADIFILLMHSSHSYGLDSERLLEVTREKLEKCKGRQWKEPDENGVREHIKGIND